MLYRPQVSSTDKSEPERVISNENSTDESKSESIKQVINKNKEKD